MITRIWHGWTSSQDADAYQKLLQSEIGPGIGARGIPGLRGPRVLRRESADDEVEFVTIMTFADWAAVAAFAGPDQQAAVVPPAARLLLKRFDKQSAHYEVVVPADI
jgi:antibiotic biosynthesis monooxygenase (ABM) superfamily enzyme